MARLLLVLAVVITCVALSQARGNRTKPKRPNGHVPLDAKEAKKLPRFIHTAKHRGVDVIPEKFDSRVKWPGCKSIADIRDQGQCGTCWAVSAASVLSDRLCIASGQKFNDYVSALNVAACTKPDDSAAAHCVSGGDAANAYKYAALSGTCTGGGFNSNAGCQPYPVSNQEIPLTCTKTCTNPSYAKKTPDQDGLTVDTYWASYLGKSMTPQQIADQVKKMQLDIMSNGPITVAIECWSDFSDWVPGNGPYSGPDTSNADDQGGHAMRCIGWDVDPKTKKSYWLITNSWGVNGGGDKGVFWIEMGKNVVGVESTISAPIVTIPNTCASSCGPIDQIVKIKPSDATGPIYAFSGNCTTQIKITADGKITPVSPSVPISKVFLGASGPIAQYLESQGKVYLIKPAPPGQNGEAAACEPTPNFKKIGCGTGSANSGTGPQTATPSKDKYIYYNDRKMMFVFKGGSNSGSGSDSVIPGSFSKVNAMQDIDGQNMLVCGTTTAGANSCGVLAYANWNAWKVAPAPAKAC